MTPINLRRDHQVAAITELKCIIFVAYMKFNVLDLYDAESFEKLNEFLVKKTPEEALEITDIAACWKRCCIYLYDKTSQHVLQVKLGTRLKSDEIINKLERNQIYHIYSDYNNYKKAQLLHERRSSLKKIIGKYITESMSEDDIFFYVSLQLRYASSNMWNPTEFTQCFQDAMWIARRSKYDRESYSMLAHYICNNRRDLMHNLQRNMRPKSDEEPPRIVGFAACIMLESLIQKHVSMAKQWTLDGNYWLPTSDINDCAGTLSTTSKGRVLLPCRFPSRIEIFDTDQQSDTDQQHNSAKLLYIIKLRDMGELCHAIETQCTGTHNVFVAILRCQTSAGSHYNVSSIKCKKYGVEEEYIGQPIRSVIHTYNGESTDAWGHLAVDESRDRIYAVVGDQLLLLDSLLKPKSGKIRGLLKRYRGKITEICMKKDEASENFPHHVCLSLKTNQLFVGHWAKKRIDVVKILPAPTGID